VLLNAKASEVETELRAQIDRALQFKVPVSHLDTHMGAVVCRPDILEVYIRLGLEYQIPVMLTKQPDAASRKVFPWLEAKAAELRPLVEESNFPVLDTLLRFNNGDTLEQRKVNYLKDIRELKPGLHQLIIHCGIANEELEGITGTWKKRDADLRVFTDPEVMDEIKKLGIEVITWKQAHEMVRMKKEVSAVE
ncbi:MAG: ChbG/HpnK family deacetylase, partial [Planctomycetaceae bacterium]|nr:ChbG/HpnK family deacetylase [Planctomycetaceae bacterium]